MNWNDILKYCPETGNLYWRVRPHKSSVSRAGDLVGYCHPDGYLRVSWKGNKYLAHRVVWEMKVGPVPEGYLLDHINHNRADNRLSNLRLVSDLDNARNQRRRKDNTSGVTGVYICSKGYCAKIRVNNKLISIGTYTSLTEATAARKAAELIHGFHPNHGSTT